MNTENIKRDWNETKTLIKQRFGKLTEQSIDAVKDDLSLLIGKLQSVYGYAKDQAEKEFASFKMSLECKTDVKSPLTPEHKVVAGEVKTPPVQSAQKVA